MPQVILNQQYLYSRCKYVIVWLLDNWHWLRNTVISALLVLYGSVQVHTQAPLSRKLYFNHLNTTNGLSQSQCMFIFRDSYGFCWISSTDGLMRYDGQDVRTYHLSDGNLSQNVQSSFFEDRDHNFWFSTMDALVCYQRKTDVLEPYFLWEKRVGLSDGAIFVFHLEAQKNRLWIALQDTLYWVDIDRLSGPEKSTAYHRLGKIEGDRCRIITDSSGAVKTLYTFERATDGGAGFWEYKLEYDSLKLVRRYCDGSDGMPLVRVKAICPEKSRMIWLATNKGLLSFEINNHRWKFHNQIATGTTVTTTNGLVCEEDQRLWVGTNLGLAAFDISEEKYTDFYPIIKNSPAGPAGNVYDLYLDQNKVLWCTINFIGVDFASLDKPKFELFTVPEKQSPPFIPTVIEEDDLGNLWFGSDMNYSKRWNRFSQTTDGWTELPYKAFMVKSLNNGQTIISTYNNSFVWSPSGAQTPVRTATGEDIAFEDVFVSSIPDQVLAVQFKEHGGLWRLKSSQDGKRFQASRIESPLLTFRFNKVFLDSKDHLFLAKDYKSLGIYKLDGDKVSFLKETPASGWTKAIYEGEKYIWAVGTYGLCRIDKKYLTCKLIQEKDGLPNNSVYGILQEEKSDFLWISTNQGLIRFHPDTLGFRQFSIADGLQDFEFNYNSFLKDSDGKLWFGGIKGINIFDPSRLPDLQVKPPIYITGLQVNDLPYPLKKNVTLLDTLLLKPDENTFSFNFVAVEFSDPSSTRLRYQLRYADNDKPYDQAWIECESPKGFARYAKLEPGKYIFAIQGANSDGIWNDEIKTIYIRVNPPFTQTLEFYILCFCLLSGIGYAGVRIYIANKLRLKNLQLREQHIHIEKQEALTQERNRIAGEMHDDLGGGLTSIRMLSERVQKKIDSPDIRSSVDKISAYSHDLVLKMSEIIWAMNSNFDTLDTLVSYIRNYAVKYLEENNIRCSVKRPHEIPDIAISGERRRNIYLAVKESLHNVVKHANADRVDIDFILNDNLEVHIQDNGKGIDPDKMSQFSNGLFNMRKRLESIGGSMELKSQDGTLVLFKIPLKTDVQ